MEFYISNWEIWENHLLKVLKIPVHCVGAGKKSRFNSWEKYVRVDGKKKRVSRNVWEKEIWKKETTEKK